MIEKNALWHYIQEDLSIRVSFIKPDAKRSNTFLRSEDLERFLEFKEPKTILKTKDRTIYELVEDEVYMEVEEASIADRHLLDTELAFIEVFQKGQSKAAKVFRLMWYEPQTFSLIIGKQGLEERIRELKEEAFFISQPSYE
ncbi:MAG: hypothetical protein ACO2PP_12575 [Thermocrinis sp.]|jgi:hypothetical protein|uniref:hypothetical protein n=1 Tax=Thermocrinis sp. TaxID=2024383 RepID=UPI003C0F6419